MLQNLNIKNFVLIDKTTVYFQTGFSVITGETGAGKSIVLQSVSLLAGARFGTQSLLDKTKKCVVESTFQLSKTHQSIFENFDVDFEAETIIRREILPSGKTRAFVNDTPVSVSILKALTNSMFSIHQQHDNLAIKTPFYWLNALDLFSKNGDFLEKHRALLSQKKQIDTQIETLISQKNDRERRCQKIQDDLEELAILQLETTDIQEKEQAFSIQNHGVLIGQTTSDILQNLSSEKEGALSSLRQISIGFEKLSDIDEDFNTLKKRIESVEIELQDIEQEVGDKQQKIELCPDTKAELEAYFVLLQKLLRRYDVLSFEDLVAVEKGLKAELTSNENLDEKIETLQKKADNIWSKIIKNGNDLSNSRHQNTAVFLGELTKIVHDLGMDKSVFNFDINKLQTPDNMGFEHYDILMKGYEKGDYQNIEKNASGGEISRIVFAVKMMLSGKQNVSTLFFDEVDTGISGSVANKMGAMMRRYAHSTQIIAITHLPQIASCANQHYKVQKTHIDNQMFSHIELLSSDAEIEELASLLSGKETGEFAIKNAKELKRSNSFSVDTKK